MPILPTASLIQRYELQPHPEGGWYQETYKSREFIPLEGLPGRFKAKRAYSTAIYFLLEAGNFSAFHRIKSDECWHFYTGDPLEIFVLPENGRMEIVTLGADLEKGHVFQYIVPANTWFASRPAEGSAYSFVGCTVAPGFDFADFEMAEAEMLSRSYPAYEKLIRQLCRQ